MNSDQREADAARPGFLPPTSQQTIEYLGAEVQRLTADVRRETADKEETVRAAWEILLENRRLREELERFRRDQPQLALDAAAFRQERNALAEALREDAAGRPVPEMLRVAAAALTAAGGGPLADCLIRKAEDVEAALARAGRTGQND